MKKLLRLKSLKLNIAANFAGNIWSAVISLVFVPFYIRYIGAEGYGLLGIFTTLQVILSLLDTGLSTTLNKELAQLSVIKGSAGHMRNLVRTLEVIYLGIALLAGVIAVSLSPLLANYWVHPKELSVQTVQNAFMLLGTGLMFQLPVGFYSGGLLGLQHHAALNAIRILFSTLRSAGGLLVLIYYSGTVTAFFSWTVLVSAAQALVMFFSVWHYLPSHTSKPIFDKKLLIKIWKFTAGMSGIAIVAVLLMQMDKIILSRILPLKEFGYYSLATTLSFLLYQIIGPLTQSYFPKFSSLLVLNEPGSLKHYYHQGSQLVSVLMLPMAFMLIVFSKELLTIWTNNYEAVENMWLVASIFAFGSSLHGLMQMPYMLTLSKGLTRLPFYTNIALLIVMIPSISLSAYYFGAVGGAGSWALLNAIYFFIYPLLVHRRILKGEASNWYWNDTLKPLLPALVFIIACKFFIIDNISGRLNVLLVLCSIGFIALAMSFFAAIKTRTEVVKYATVLFGKKKFE